MIRHALLASILAIVVISAALLTATLPKAVTIANAGDEVKKPEQYTFVGSKKCRMCHKKENVGNQYGKWQESAHSKAFETLATPKAAEFAKAREIEGSPQEAEACIKCHVTAYAMSAEELAASKITIEEGVSCESCHGPGSAYAKKKTMQSITDGDLDPATVGLVLPNEEVCVRCHNEESPAYSKEFDFKASYAKIAHLRPKKPATKE